MTIQQLAYIVALDKYRHFVQAAESCFVTQPTLTMQLKKLEDEIGMVIFDRQKQPLEPTNSGTQFISKAREILAEINVLKSFVSDEKESLKGNFTIGVIPTLAPYLLPLFVKDFNENFPGLNFTIKENQSEVLIQELKNQKTDLAFMVGPLAEKSLREVSLFNEPLVLYLPEGHELHNADEINGKALFRDDLIIMEEGHCFRNQLLSVCGDQKNKTKKINYEGGSIETLKNLVKNDFGFTLIPELAINVEDQKHVKTFKTQIPVREVCLVSHMGFTKNRLIDELRKSVLSKIPDHFSKNEHFVRVKWR